MQAYHQLQHHHCQLHHHRCYQDHRRCQLQHHHRCQLLHHHHCQLRHHRCRLYHHQNQPTASLSVIYPQNWLVTSQQGYMLLCRHPTLFLNRKWG